MPKTTMVGATVGEQEPEPPSADEQNEESSAGTSSSTSPGKPSSRLSAFGSAGRPRVRTTGNL